MQMWDFCSASVVFCFAARVQARNSGRRCGFRNSGLDFEQRRGRKPRAGTGRRHFHTNGSTNLKSSRHCRRFSFFFFPGFSEARICDSDRPPQPVNGHTSGTRVRCVMMMSLGTGNMLVRDALIWAVIGAPPTREKVGRTAARLCAGSRTSP